MIRISLNVISSSLDLLKWINNGIVNKNVEIECLDFESRIKPVDIYELCVLCELIRLEDTLSLTERGKMLMQKLGRDVNDQSGLRDYIRFYIIKSKPIWANRIIYGRKEACFYMSKDEKSCFIEAGLLSKDVDDAVIEWWDNISDFFRAKKNEGLEKIGRVGEKLTLKYEKERVIKSPVWKSIDSNLVGYDIESISEKESTETLLIEVKASNRSILEAEFFISSNEWNTAIVSENYVFYLWLIMKNEVRLAKIKPRKLKKYMPINNEVGEWVSAKIPYSVFEDNFEKQNLTFYEEN